jgi:hypothetical protein
MLNDESLERRAGLRAAMCDSGRDTLEYACVVSLDPPRPIDMQAHDGSTDKMRHIVF